MLFSSQRKCYMVINDKKMKNHDMKDQTCWRWRVIVSRVTTLLLGDTVLLNVPLWKEAPFVTITGIAVQWCHSRPIRKLFTTAKEDKENGPLSVSYNSFNQHWEKNIYMRHRWSSLSSEGFACFLMVFSSSSQHGMSRFFLSVKPQKTQMMKLVAIVNYLLDT